MGADGNWGCLAPSELKELLHALG
eukprot:COSAG01_NODE_47965_length_385_cov_1.069930_1_plen_23_part_10